VPGLERLDVLVTETALAGAWHERLLRLFPGIDDVRTGREGEGTEPVLIVPPSNGIVHTTRDREEEVAAFARRVKRAARSDPATPIDRMALVVRRPLPYVYLAREVLRSAGVPCQTFDALPLAAEPYAAMLDLVFTFVASNFARTPAVALLRSPHLRFGHDGDPVPPSDIAALDGALSQAGYLGGIETLEPIVGVWVAANPPVSGSASSPVRGARAGEAALAAARELSPLRSHASVADHIDVLLRFLRSHDALPASDDLLRPRQLRARAAILGALIALRAAHARFDATTGSFEDLAATIRRWIEGQTFAPRTGETGAHLVDADSAPYGDFDEVQLAGLVDGEWPEPQRGSIFYSPGLLRELGWPSESERADGARSAFRDLLRLPARRLVVSTFVLENDALVTSSPLLDEVDGAALEGVEESAPASRIFEFEALGFHPVRMEHLGGTAAAWARFRVAAQATDQGRQRGATTGHRAASFSVSALERYQDCPFKFFAADVLRLEEAPEDESVLSPRARGRFIHEVFQAFFATWDRRGDGTITAERLDEARALFADVAEPLLARLPEGNASLERTRLFGSAIAMGLVDVVLGLEASRSGRVVERWLEYGLNGEFTLGTPGPRARLRGVADRVDLLEGRRLRVIDYKSGSAPNPKRALQVAVYALCALERLEMRDGVAWSVDEAAYVAFSGRRTLVPVVKAGGGDPAAVLAAARQRLFDTLDGVDRGEFPPRPHDPMICGYCAYSSVCRKDYVGDE
jgi:RecB family exonuclease